MRPRDSHPVPDTLWKYRSWNSYAKKLINGEVYFSTHSELNDPFEFKWRQRPPRYLGDKLVLIRQLVRHKEPHLEDDSDEQREAIRRYMLKLSNAPQGEFQTARKIEHGVFCACESPSDIRMWSHYSQNHTGLCVGVSPRLMKHNFARVEYVQRLPTYEMIYLFGPEKGILNAVATKSIDWQYEKEWRTFSTPGPKEFEKPVIQKIVCGCAMSQENRDELKEFIVNNEIKAELLQAEMSEFEFKIEIRPME